MGKIKDITLADKGKVSYEWALQNMKILNSTISKLADEKPFKSHTIACCLHITKETSVLLMGLKKLGANVVCCPGNPLTTQDDIAAFLEDEGINTYAWYGQTQEGYEECIDSTLLHRPDILIDDGADMNIKAHFDKRYKDLNIFGATEETTAGVNRIKAVENARKLKYPVILVNDAYTKHLFDNRYGTGQSTIDAFLRSANLLMAGKTIVVAGYGWVGKGVAARCSGMNSIVIVTEVDPIRALEAKMDGYRVMPMNEASSMGDIFITTTGMRDIIRKEHFHSMKDGVILGNVGHFDVEIDTGVLFSKKNRSIRPGLDEYDYDGKRIYLIGKGRLANLAGAEGHPPEVMALSFSNQLLSALYILKNHDIMPKKLLKVPDDIDRQVAVDALEAMDVRIDHLNDKQREYAKKW